MKTIVVQQELVFPMDDYGTHLESILRVMADRCRAYGVAVIGGMVGEKDALKVCASPRCSVAFRPHDPRQKYCDNACRNRTNAYDWYTRHGRKRT